MIVAFASESLTVSTTSVSLSATVYQPAGAVPARQAFITIETNSIRYVLDGATPSPSNAILVGTSTSIRLSNLSDIGDFRAVRGSAPDAVIRVTYFR